MKKIILLSAGLLASTAGFAQDVGRVLSSAPVLQAVAVPRQVCTTEQVALQRPNSGAGAVLGAIAGGAIGNAATHGPGQAAATALGLFGGAMLGDRIEGSAAPQWQDVQRCTVQTAYENRTIGFDVVYEFAGKQYAVRLPQDPGPTIALQVTPVGMAALAADAPQVTVQPQPTYVQAAPAVVVQPTYPAYVYAPRPYYPPVALNLGFGYWEGGHRGHHWRR